MMRKLFGSVLASLLVSASSSVAAEVGVYIWQISNHQSDVSSSVSDAISQFESKRDPSTFFDLSKFDRLQLDIEFDKSDFDVAGLLHAIDDSDHSSGWHPVDGSCEDRYGNAVFLHCSLDLLTEGDLLLVFRNSYASGVIYYRYGEAELNLISVD